MERVFAVLRAPGPAWDDSKPLEGTRDALLILHASSASEIVERLAVDPWTTNGLLVTRQISPWSNEGTCEKARRLRIWTEDSCFDFRLRQYVLAK